MLFTSLQLTANAKPSVIFKERGNGTDMPAAVSDLCMIAQRNFENPSFNLFANYLPHIMAATSSNSILAVMPGYSFLVNSRTSRHVSSPTIALKFNNSNNQTLSDNLAGLGFTKDSKGKSVYFRGQINDSNVGTVLALGSDLDPHVPYGVTTIKGYLAYIASSRILNSILNTAST